MRMCVQSGLRSSGEAGAECCWLTAPAPGRGGIVKVFIAEYGLLSLVVLSFSACFVFFAWSLKLQTLTVSAVETGGKCDIVRLPCL